MIERDSIEFHIVASSTVILSTTVYYSKSIPTYLN
jgi:hypothetical protein